MKPTFDKQAALQLGTAIGDLLNATKERYEVKNHDLYIMMLSATAGMAQSLHVGLVEHRARSAESYRTVLQALTPTLEIVP